MPDQLTERQRKFVEQPRIGRLGTTMRDGSPHISPVWYRFEDGAFLVLVERTSQKHRNIERDPRVAFCIDDEHAPYHTVLVRGRVVVEEAPGREWREAIFAEMEKIDSLNATERLVERAPDLAGRGEAFVIATDDAGQTEIRFGDGLTGAIPPAGDGTEPMSS